jgi:hypothetical protein
LGVKLLCPYLYLFFLDFVFFFFFLA